jgi:hypothetical protein
LTWLGVASSADGKKLPASGYSNSTGYCLYYSTNAGEVWNQGESQSFQTIPAGLHSQTECALILASCPATQTLARPHIDVIACAGSFNCREA